MVDPALDKQIIPLSRMPQQASVRDAGDDWTGVINRKERRRLQNRLNQRRFLPYYLLGSKKQGNEAKSQSAITSTTPSSLHNSRIRPHDFDEENGETWECQFAPPNALQFRNLFEAKAYECYMSGTPDRDHLVSLSRLNVHKAINENIRAVGMTSIWMRDDDSISIFNLSQPSFSIDQIPPCLRPTFIQLHVPHHPWLDFFPFPRMRDYMILAGDSFDDEDLCHDIMAFWDTRNTAATLLVWGDSWDAKNWEVSEGFAHKWKCLLMDSPELLASTNRWRRMRGEKPFIWKDILNVK
ncbi:hypothetical protein N7462_000422 [Penicillium macrosclerotiorum]|uniref:uncharacterized protein n=1 Tax=Penicillium macrosclerotiorum TaxID=303699 RepID=UPI002547279D|nr:uncharacterized protein N7462_000422 [Penicillium macrosclerotiorum]KAJ5698417.1 hypothetical protein N7462_000422 [Penicillium macrosclerotiorum]